MAKPATGRSLHHAKAPRYQNAGQACLGAAAQADRMQADKMQAEELRLKPTGTHQLSLAQRPLKTCGLNLQL